MGAASLFSTAGGIYQEDRAARRAARTQEEAAQAANAMEMEMYKQNRADLEPWRVAGSSALEQLMRLQGFQKTATAPQDGQKTPGYTWTPGGNQADVLQMDPGYRFRQQEGQNALSRALAARGMRNSGAALKEAARYNQDLASQEYSNLFNRLAGTSGTGQVTSNQLAALGSNYASQYGQNLGQAANARASGYVARSQIGKNALADILSAMAMGG